MQTELNNLLYEEVLSAKKRAAEAFDKLAGGENKKIVLFGSGELGRRTNKGLNELGVEVACYADNNKKLWGSEINGVKVLSPEEAANMYPEAVFVLTIWSANIGHPIQEVQAQLSAFGKIRVVSFIYLYWKYPETFLPYWRCDLPFKTIEQFELVSSAFSLWSDEASQREYLAQIIWRLTGDSSKLANPVAFDQYFPDDIFEVNNDEVFADIGAFDGDTLKVFLEKTAGNFKHYYAYEPDPFGYLKLNEFLSTLSSDLSDKITAEPIGIGSHKETIMIETPGSYFKILFPEEAAEHASKNPTGFAPVMSRSIDELAFGDIPTYIKMDVEGFEPHIIFGAQNFIKQHKPIIAIAIYHTFDHLWRLPLAVNALSKDYDFYLRPHCRAGWELICYAVPKNRLK